MKINYQLLTTKLFGKSADKSSHFGLLVMVLAVIAFTANTMILKWLALNREISPSVALLFRAVVGAVMVFCLFRNSAKPLNVPAVFKRKKLVWRGITGIIGTAAYYYTVPTLGAGKATLLCNSYVLFAAIIAMVFLRELLSKLQVFWLVVSFIGIALLLGEGSSFLRPSIGFYEIIGLIGAIAAASTVVLIRQLTREFSNGTIFMAQCLWVGIPILPFALPHLASLQLIDLVLLTIAASMAATGQLFMNEGFRRLPVTQGAAIQNTWPLMATIGGIVFFGELFAAAQLIGGALILWGTYQISRRRNRS